MTENGWDKCRPRDKFVRPRLTVEALKKRFVPEKIEKYIGEIYNDFTGDLSKCIHPCKRFRKDAFYDNYSDNLYQQFYLLRYLVVYAFECKEMFTDILCDLYLNGIRESIKVSSLGCGSAIDFWALETVVNELNIDFESIDYRGVDTVDWKYSFGRDNNICKKTITKEDAGLFLENKECLDENVFIFPRSIGDFSSDAFQKICDAFKQKKIINKCIYLMVSGIQSKDDKKNKRNIDRFNALIDAINNDNFTLTCWLKYHASDPEKGVTGVDKSISYPTWVLKNGSKINIKCNKWIDELYCKDCSFERHVMLKCKNVNYVLLKFERK